MSETVDNEELAAFVTATLTAIATGVETASNSATRQTRNGHSTFEMPNKVSFDIAVTAKRTTQGGGGLKVQVFSVGGGVDGRHASESETVSRISFEVPWHHKSTAPINVPRTRTAFNG